MFEKKKKILKILGGFVGIIIAVGAHLEFANFNFPLLHTYNVRCMARSTFVEKVKKSVLYSCGVNFSI